MAKFIPAVPGISHKVMTVLPEISIDNALISAFYGIPDGKFSGIELKKKLRLELLVGDSGGFQILNHELTNKKFPYTKEQIFRWLCDNVDYAINIDYPLSPDKEIRGVTTEIKNNLSKSITNFAYFEEMIKCSKDIKTKFLSVLHGSCRNHYEIWYEGVKQFNFDGWALAAKPTSNPLVIADGFCFLASKIDINRQALVHVLGVSNIASSLLINYINLHYPELLITYDSSSWVSGSKYRYYSILGEMNDSSLQIGDNDTKVLELVKNKRYLPCDCPSCTSFNKNFDTNFNTPSLLGIHISVHNLYKSKKIHDFMSYFAVKGQVETYKNICETIFSKFYKITFRDSMLFNAIDYIDTFIEYGYEMAYNKYRTKLEYQFGGTTQPLDMGLFE